jgi:hypothetical protein
VDVPNATIGEDGRKYQDFFKVISDGRNDWENIIYLLKKEFTNYPRVFEKGKNSSSRDGNFLEAITLALTVYQRVTLPLLFSCFFF